jgi:hypothetical protein
MDDVGAWPISASGWSGDFEGDASAAFTHNYAPAFVIAQSLLQNLNASFYLIEPGEPPTPRHAADTFISQYVQNGTPNDSYTTFVRGAGITSITFQLNVAKCEARAMFLEHFWYTGAPG